MFFLNLIKKKVLFTILLYDYSVCIFAHVYYASSYVHMYISLTHSNTLVRIEIKVATGKRQWVLGAFKMRAKTYNRKEYNSYLYRKAFV